MPKPQYVAYRAMWERAQSVAMCQAILVAVALGADEFAGFCGGYIGEGEFVTEPFHVRFRGEEAVHLVIGERSPLSRKEVLFNQWPDAARDAVMMARHQYRALISDDEEGVLTASPAAVRCIKWDEFDEGISEHGKVDPRVWLRVTAQLGLTGPAQVDE